MRTKYYINAHNFISCVTDLEDVEFHLDQDDYFGTIATVLDLISQEKKLKLNKEKLDKKHELLLSQISKDFLFLQKNYKITKK